MKRINWVKRIAVVLLALPTVALGHDNRDRAWERSAIESYRYTHPHRITTGHIEGFRIIIRDGDVSGIGYTYDRRDHGVFFADDRHRFNREPHRWYDHDSRIRLGQERWERPWQGREWPDQQWKGHKQHGGHHFKHGRHHHRPLGWSGTRGDHRR